MKKRRTKKSRNWIYVLMLACTIGFSISSFSEIKTWFDLKQSIIKTKADTKSVKAKQESLKKEKEKLLDPAYIEYLARGKYLVTKDGEQVFKFSDDQTNP